jgi:hypothetical protein
MLLQRHSQFQPICPAKYAASTAHVAHTQRLLRDSSPHSRSFRLSSRPVTQGTTLDLVQEDTIATPADNATATDAASTPPAFQWERCWYPVMPLDYLDPSRPTQVTVLNKQFALWRDSNGEWRCFRDACPHRLAPLSGASRQHGASETSCQGWSCA